MQIESETARARAIIMADTRTKRYEEFYQIIKFWPSAPLSELDGMLDKVASHGKNWNGLNPVEQTYRGFIQDRIFRGDDVGRVISFSGYGRT